MSKITLNVGCDVGTREGGMVAELVTDGKASGIYVVLLPGTQHSQTPEWPQILVYHNGDLVYGKKVSGVVAKHSHLQNKVMELYKLALHDSFKHYPEVAHVKKVLRTHKDRGALQDLFTDLFRCLKRDLLAYFRGRMTTTPIDFDSVELVFQISVPAMWGDEQRGVIRNAARGAGISKVELREEPLCAITTSMLELHRDGLVKKKQSVLQMDVGGGTTDVTLSEMCQEPSGDQQMELRRIGKCSGSPTGSHMLNYEFLKDVMSGQCPKVHNPRITCEALRISKREFLRHLSDEFDDLKKTTKKIRRATVSQSTGVPKKWYNKWIHANEELLREHVRHVIEHATDNDLDLDVVCAVFTGKGFRYDALRSKMESILRETWPGINLVPILSDHQELNCARGALLHHLFQEDSLPPSVYFYLARKEYYDRKTHTDITEPLTSKYDRTERIVEDRLRRIMRYKNGQWTVPNNMGMTPMTFYVEMEGPKDSGRLHVDLYWSRQWHNQTSPAKDENGNLWTGLRCFPLVFLDIVDLEKHGFQIVNAEDEGGEGNYDDDDNDDNVENGEDDGDSEDDKDGEDELPAPESERTSRFYEGGSQKTIRRPTARTSGLDFRPMQTNTPADAPSSIGAGNEDVEMGEDSEAGEDDEEDEDDEMSESDNDEDDNDDDEDDNDDDWDDWDDQKVEERENQNGSGENGKDKKHCLVKAFVEMKGTADQLALTLYLMKPTFEYERSDRGRIKPARSHADLNEDDIFKVHTQTVWSKDSSHFVSATTGTSGPRGI